MSYFNFNPQTDIEKLTVLVMADQPPNNVNLLEEWLFKANLPILKKYLQEYIEQIKGGAVINGDTFHEAYAEIAKEKGVPAYAGGGTIGSVKEWWDSVDLSLLPDTVQVFIKEQLMNPPENFNFDDPTFVETKEMIERYITAHHMQVAEEKKDELMPTAEQAPIEEIIEEPARTTFISTEQVTELSDEDREHIEHADAQVESLQETIKAARKAQKELKVPLYIFKHIDNTYFFAKDKLAGENLIMDLPYLDKEFIDEKFNDDIKTLRDEVENLEPALQYLSGNDKKEVKEKIATIKQALELLSGEMATGGDATVNDKTVIDFLKALEKSKIAANGSHKNKEYIDTVKSIVSMSEKEFSNFDKKENKNSARVIYFEFKDWIETYSPEKKSHGGNVSHDQREMDRIALSKLNEYSTKLFSIITDNVPAWVSAKISKTELVVASVKHALEAQHPDLFKSGGDLSTGNFAKMQLKHIHKYTEILIYNFDKIKFEAWQSSNLYMVADYLDSVFHYLDYEKKPRLATGGTPGEKLEDANFSAKLNFNSKILSDLKYEGMPLNIGALTLSLDGRNIVLDAKNTDYSNPQKQGSVFSFSSDLEIDKDTFEPNDDFNYNLLVSDLKDKKLKAEIYLTDEDMGEGDGQIDLENASITLEVELASETVTINVERETFKIGGKMSPAKPKRKTGGSADDSKVIQKIGNTLIWFSKGDSFPYWTSDLEGGEIEAFETKKEALASVLATGEMAIGGKTSYDTIKVGDKFTIKQMREFLDNKFADSFQFEVWPLKKGTRCEPERDDYKGKKIKYKGLEDSDLSGKLRFPQYRPAHEINYEINQGGENTYFYFLLEDEKNDGFVGHFGFKDDGDVSPEWITGFIAFLQEYYGLPFNVEHSVYGKGGGLEKFIIWNGTDKITAWPGSMSKEKGEKWIKDTRKRFKDGQGYYSNNRGQQMNPDDVEYILVPEKEFSKRLGELLK